MDKKHYHVPLPSRPLCPVCKKAVYSRGGIHPQCAMLREDALNPIKKVLLPAGASVVAEIGVKEPQSPVKGGSPALT
ncbi:MAG: hypothetical protein ACLQIB_03325 [Isosphaeraceae bacterium]